jgi:hypothetical protein
LNVLQFAHQLYMGFEVPKAKAPARWRCGSLTCGDGSKPQRCQVSRQSRNKLRSKAMYNRSISYDVPSFSAPECIHYK